MAIQIYAEDRVTGAVGDEEVYLPGARPGHDQEGPYEFTFPRIGKLLKMQRRLKGLNLAQAAVEEIDGMLQWLAAGFGPDAWEHIDARLADDDDLLDEEHMVRLFQLLNEGSTGTGRPTTSSNGASRQPWKNTQTAAPSLQGSGSPS
jgi:hypothetical protein